MRNTGIRKLAEALVFAHGDGAYDEARRQQALNERSGNFKLAEEWAGVINFMPVVEPPRLNQAA